MIGIERHFFQLHYDDIANCSNAIEKQTYEFCVRRRGICAVDVLLFSMQKKDMKMKHVQR